MKIAPSLGEAKKIAATGKFDVLPVSCEILSDFTTPIETMKILKNVSTHCFMLESAWADRKMGKIYVSRIRPEAGNHLHRRRYEDRKSQLPNGKSLRIAPAHTRRL